MRLRGPNAWSCDDGTVEVTVGCRDCGWEAVKQLGRDRGKATEDEVKAALATVKALYDAHACKGRAA